MSAAQSVTVARRVDCPVGDLVFTVLVAEGCGQVIVHRGLPGPLVSQAFCNVFVVEGMAQQLRALADAVARVVPAEAVSSIENSEGFKCI